MSGLGEIFYFFRYICRNQSRPAVTNSNHSVGSVRMALTKHARTVSSTGFYVNFSFAIVAFLMLFLCFASCVFSLGHAVVWNHSSLSSKCISKRIIFRRIVSSLGSSRNPLSAALLCLCFVLSVKVSCIVCVCAHIVDL